jgi:HlyD family secretion protein
VTHSQRLSLALAPLALASALLAVSCRPARQAAAELPKTVTAAPVHRGTLAITIDYPARIRPREEIVVAAKVSGRASTVQASVGQRVRRGQVLFTLEARDYEAQYRQAKAALESARANLTRTSDSTLGQQVLQAQAAVNQAQVQADDARDVAERTRKLYESGTIPRQQLDSVEARSKSAQIALSSAKESLALIQDKSGPQSSSVVSAQVEQAQAQADLAESQLENAEVTSPIDGVVSVRNVDPGEIIAAGVPAFVVIDTSTLLAETSVSDRLVEKISRGQTVTVTVAAAGGAILRGAVDTVNPSVDPRTQSYAVKVLVSDPSGEIRPGMFATVAFPVEKREDALLLPNGAIITENRADFVLVVSDGVLKKRGVTTGISDDAVTEIVSGLSEGEVVVSEGQSFLTEGQRVTVAK